MIDLAKGVLILAGQVFLADVIFLHGCPINDLGDVIHMDESKDTVLQHPGRHATPQYPANILAGGLWIARTENCHWIYHDQGKLLVLIQFPCNLIPFVLSMEILAEPH